MKVPSLEVGKQLQVGAGEAKALGKGIDVLRGSAYVEGPLQVGDDEAFGEVTATVMIGREENTDAEEQPDRSLNVRGNVNIEGDDETSFGLEVSGGSSEPLHVKGDIICDAISPKSIAERFEVADAKPKPFDLKHPTKDGYRLRYACIEGPEAGVYVRGRVCNGKNVIDLPDYWRGLVDYETLTVQLTAIGSHQNVIVKRVSPIEQKIYLQSQGGMPVDCFYHIFAERKDVNKLIVEYEGDSHTDYPDPQYDDPKYGRQNVVTG
tara:strand:+ start:3019 stop:3810 length:792 start_codon:yes stop_codon:yes gene_type:complete